MQLTQFDNYLSYVTHKAERVSLRLPFFLLSVLMYQHTLHPKDLSVDVPDSVASAGAQFNCPIPVLAVGI